MPNFSSWHRQGAFFAASVVLIISFQNCAPTRPDSGETAVDMSSYSNLEEIPINGSSSNQIQGEIPISDTAVAAIAFSLSYNGVPVRSVSSGALVYGVVYGLSNYNVYACSAPAGTDSCNDRAKWTPFPNADWTYNTNDRTWRMRGNLNFPANTYVMYIEDRSRNKSATTSLVVQ